MSIPSLSLVRLGTVTLSAALVLFVQPSAVSQQEEFVSTPHVEQAEPEEPGCFSPKIVATTDRPSASSGTETTQCGVLEIVAGPERIWQDHGVHQDGFAPSLQFGLTPKLDLHYARAVFFPLGGNPGPLSGQGDTFVGARYRFSKQGRFVPSFGTFYTLKVPTGSVSEGFGSGRFDHQLMMIASKDISRLHVDFNLMPNLVGRTGETGFDRNTALALFGSVATLRNLHLSAGIFQSSRLNTDTPSFVLASAGLVWQVHPKLILDVGMDEGLTSDAPHKRLCFGFSYAPANLYALIAGPRERTR